MNVAQIQTLDDGVNGVSAVGTVTYTKPAVNKVGDKDGRHYDFWSQFVVIKDASGEMGVHLTVGAGEQVFKGQQITVEKGKVGSYFDDKNNLRKTLSGSLVSGQSGMLQGQQPRQAPNAPPPAPQRPQNAGADHERRVRNRGICLSYALEHLTIPLQDAYAEALRMAEFVETGIIPKPQPRQEVRHQTEPDGYDASNVPDPDPSIQEQDAPTGDEIAF